MRTLIIGCGYIGAELGRVLLAAGHQVDGVVRSPESLERLERLGIKPWVADLGVRGSLDGLPRDYEWVVHCASSSKGGVEAYRQVFVDGMKNLLEWTSGLPLKRLVYTSSTSVYGQTDGSQVKESSPTEPATETGKMLVEAERLLISAAGERGLPAVILRVAGIYGPDRGHLFHQFLKNEARLQGDGLRWINMIHRTDVVGGMSAALRDGRKGEVYNLVDDEPVTQLQFLRWLSETLGKWMPPAAEAHELEGRKRGLTNKRVSNRRLKMELGYRLVFPSFRQGYTDEIRRLDAEGLLKIEPDPR